MKDDLAFNKTIIFYVGDENEIPELASSNRRLSYNEQCIMIWKELQNIERDKDGILAFSITKKEVAFTIIIQLYYKTQE